LLAGDARIFDDLDLAGAVEDDDDDLFLPGSKVVNKVIRTEESGEDNDLFR